jgi:hypothetical protein
MSADANSRHHFEHMNPKHQNKKSNFIWPDFLMFYSLPYRDGSQSSMSNFLDFISYSDIAMQIKIQIKTRKCSIF